MRNIKHFKILMLTAIMLLAFALPAFAITDKQQKEINDLQKQMFETRQKLIDKYVESGQLPADKAKLIKEKMAKRYEAKKKDGFKFNFEKKFKQGHGGKCPAAPGAEKPQAAPEKKTNTSL